MTTLTTEQELHEYLNKKGVKKLLEDMLEDVLQKRPDEPVKHIYNYLRKNFAAQLSSPDVNPVANELEAMLAKTLADAPKDDAGDDDRAPSPPPDSRAPAVSLRQGMAKNRRKSVCAEPITPDDLSKNFTPKVYPKSDEEKQRIKEVISHNILFANLEEKQKNIIMDAMFEVNKEPGDTIIKQGDEGDNFYVIDQGNCDVYVKIGGEDKHVLACGPGDSFGELALMYNAPRAATVKARDNARLWAVDRLTFKFILMDTTIKQRNLYESFLEKVPLLSNLMRYERLTVADALGKQEFKAGDVIIKQGDPGDQFYIIEEGEVVCLQSPEPGKPEMEVGQLKSGDYFGEIALLTNKPRAATVKAVTDVATLSLSRATFTRVMGPLQDILKRNIGAYRSYISLV
eukprot:tig00020801_g13969.t2